MIGDYIMAREEGRYRAIGGHAASPGDSVVGGFYVCHVCSRSVTRSERSRSGWMHRPAVRSRSTKPIPAVRAYFHRWHPEHDSQTPNIFEAFRPGEGWQRYPIRKRVSRSWLRKMRREGYIRVGLSVGPYDYIVADFSISELI